MKNLPFKRKPIKPKSYITCLIVITILTSTCYAVGNQPTANSPIDFGDLILWLDANDTATLFTNSACTTAITTDADVGCWQDKSGEDNHVIQTTAAMPNYRINQQNTLPAIEFVNGGGNDDLLITNTAGQITANGSYTKVVVFSYDDLTTAHNLISSASTNGTAFWGGNGANTGRLHAWNLTGATGNPGHVSSQNQLTTGQYYVATTRYDNIANDGHLSVLNINGTQVDSDDTVQTHAAQVISIGNHGNTNGLDGRIAEAIVYNRALTDMEIDCVEAYLGEKWSITTSNLGAECAIGSSITLDETNYPEFKIFQRDNNDQYSFLLNGDFIGTCTTVEASFNGSAFTIIDAVPTAGSFSGTLSAQPVGQGDLSVRCSNDIALIDTANSIGIGDVYVVAGQSNAEGRALNQQFYTDIAQNTTVFPTVFSQNNIWFIGDDDTDPTTAAGSIWPIVGGYIVENTDIPVAFITVSTGATALVNPPEWQKGGATCNGALNCYAQMTAQVTNSGVNGVKAILWHQGESDAFVHNVSRTDYSNAFDQFVSDVQADIAGSPEVIAGAIGQWINHDPFVTPIRLALMDAWESNSAVLYGPQTYDIEISNDGGTDNVHFINDDEIQTFAFRWWKALEDHYYGGSQGRGPVIESAIATQGATEIVLTFTANSNLAPASLSTAAWLVNDNGTNIGVTSANVTASNTVTLTLSASLTSQTVDVTYALDNSGEGNALTDSTTGNILTGTSPLPADPFNNYTVTFNDIVFLDGFEFSLPNNSVQIHEDAEDGNTDNWSYYGTTAGSIATNVADNGGRAIELSGNNGVDNGFSFENLNIQSGFIASWQLKYSNGFRFFAIIRTANSPNNNIYLEYTPHDISTGQSGSFIHHGLGANVNDGTWHTFTRDLEADLNATLPNDTLTEIIGFSIRGSGRIDNIMTFERQAQEEFDYNGHHYKIVKTAMNWQDAATFANNQGGYLANIGSIAENHEIYSRLNRFVAQNEYAGTVASNGGDASYIWIGANDLDVPNTWIWENNSEQFWQGLTGGNPVGGLYNNWGKDTNENPHEPDNAGIQQSAAIALTRWPIGSGSLGQTSQWNDLISADPLFFIVEFD